MSRQAILPFVPTLPLVGASEPSVELWLRRVLQRKEPVVLGQDEADPYSPEPGKSPFVRNLLTALVRAEGLEISITTRSPRVLQDLSLLTDLDQRHAVRVDVPLPAADVDLVRRIEPREPEPAARLWAVSQLAAEGIATRVVVKPLLPGINDGEETLRALFEAALEAGAWDVTADPVPASRVQFSLWHRNDKNDSSGREDLLALIRRLRLEHGFPRAVAGRG